MPQLQALLDQTPLDLTLHNGRPETPFAAVTLADRATERTWPAPNDLRLAEAATADSRALLANHPAAVGVLLTTRQPEVPAPLRQQAERRGTALFSIPPTVSLSRVQGAALGLLAQERLPELQAAAGLHAFLLASLDSPKPERELLARLHTLSGRSFLLLSPWNTVLARSGPSGWRAPGLQPEALPSGPIDMGGQRLLALRIEEGGRLLAVLLMLSAAESQRPLLELAQGILRLAALARRAEARHQQALRSALLNEWLAGTSDPGDLRARLAQAGIEPRSGYLLAVCEPGERARPNRQKRQVEHLRQAGNTYFQTLGLPVLEAERAGHCLWLASIPDPQAHLAPLVRALQAGTEEPFRLGLSGAQHDPAGAAAAYRQALLAAQTVTEGQGGRVFSRLDPVSWLLEQQPAANLRALHDQLVGPIRAADDNGKLWRTLLAYLRTPSDMQSLAGRLHIHVNTLRYRLGRIEELIGRPLAQPETLARLYLAEQIDGMLAERPQGEG